MFGDDVPSLAAIKILSWYALIIFRILSVSGENFVLSCVAQELQTTSIFHEDSIDCQFQYILVRLNNIEKYSRKLLMI